MLNTAFLEKYGRWALVTGGSEGVGSAWVDALVEKGLGIIIMARRESLIEAKAKEMRDRGATVRTLLADCRAPDTIQRLKDLASDIELGLVVHNVGGVGRQPVGYFDDPLNVVEGVIEINTLVPARLVYEFAPAMKARRRGGIVIVGSLSGMAGQPTQAAYSAAKAFEQVFCEAMWSELKDFGVDVVSVPLGGTRTPGLSKSGMHGIDPETIPTAKQVVDEAIENIANGPVFVPTEANRKFFDKVTRMPRRDAAETMARLAYRSNAANA